MYKKLMNLVERLVSVRTFDTDQSWRGRMLGHMLLLSIFAGSVLTVIDVMVAIAKPGSIWLYYSITDLIALCVLIGLLWLNQRGRVRTAAFIFFISIIVAIPVLFQTDNLGFVLVAYALPVIAASFVIGPWASLLMAVFSGISYTAGFFLSRVNHTYDYVGIVVLFVLAWVAWIASDSLEKNIKDRIRSVEAMRQNEARYRFFIEGSSDIIWQTDRDLVLTYINPADERIRGFRSEEVVGKPIFANLKPEMSEFLARELEVDLQGEAAGRWPGPSRYEMEQLCKDGRYIWTEVYVNPLISPQGRLEGYNGISHDITERRLAEHKLREITNWLEEAERVAHVGCWAFDMRRGTVWASQEARRIYGLGNGELAIRSVQEVPLLEYRPLLDQALKSLIEENTPYDLEFRILRKDDGVLRAIHSLAEYDAAEQRVFGVIQDITEQRATEEQYRLLNLELEERVRERTFLLEQANTNLESFSYSVSHDLRSPLRAMEGFSQVLLDDYAPRMEEPALKYVQRIRSGARRMSQLIDDLLRLSRVSQAEIFVTKVDLGLIASQVLAELQEQHPDRQVEAIVPQRVFAFADRNLVRILLDNLLMNAWKFTGQHPSARIEFGQVQQDGETVFFVRDDGAGFDPLYAGKLFGVFQRLHHESQFPGTGIGLATVLRIVQRHGGRIWAEGEVEKGACFYFTLPTEKRTGTGPI
jgi:PAS domain S-box-containing protein